VTFPLFDKIDVNGPEAHPLYQFLKSSKRGLFGSDIKWNFTKFLVDHQGKVIKRYASAVTPFQFEKDIVKLIEKV
jgi:glutathione peroxidase